MLDDTAMDVTQPLAAPDGVEHHRCGSRSAWGVVQAHPQAERWALENLTRQGYPAYLPLVAVQRRDRALRSLVRTVLAPLFPGYLFVQPGTHWGPIAHSFGVRRLLLSDGTPHLLPPGVCEALQATEQLRRTLAPAASLWRPGAACRLSSGPFAGQDGVVLAIRRDRATVALMCLGGLRQVQTPIGSLEPRC
jgi:transcription antitermination factor NusG